MADSGYPVGVISIHALHEESDTPVHVVTEILFIISIHALHEESDCLTQCRKLTPISHFNPRSP